MIMTVTFKSNATRRNFDARFGETARAAQTHKMTVTNFILEVEDGTAYIIKDDVRVLPGFPANMINQFFNK